MVKQFFWNRTFNKLDKQRIWIIWNYLISFKEKHYLKRGFFQSTMQLTHENFFNNTFMSLVRKISFSLLSNFSGERF